MEFCGGVVVGALALLVVQAATIYYFLVYVPAL